MPELVCAAGDRDAWLAARRTGITATDIVAILGLSSHDSPYSLYWRKLGQVPEQPGNDRLRLGLELKPLILNRWRDEHIDCCSAIASRALFRSDARPWQMATPDAVTYKDGREHFAGVFEGKSWADADRHAWQDGPPSQVRAQVLWQMDVMDVATGHVGVLFLPSGEFRSHKISHASTRFHETCDICQDISLMRVAGREFYDRLQDLAPPNPDSSAATLAAVKARFLKRKGKRAVIDPGLWGQWIVARAAMDGAEQAARGYESKIREQLGEADEIEVDGELVARRITGDSPVKAHTRHSDYIRKVKTND